MDRTQRLKIRITQESERWERLSTILAKLQLCRDFETRPEESMRLDHLIRRLTADRAGVESALERLEDRLDATGAESASDRPPRPDEPPPRGKAIEVFYSYAHEDEALRDELDKHLTLLRRRGVIATWHDRNISAGSEWHREISERLEAAAIILLLVSPDFIASDYIWGKELKRAMARHEAHQAVVIPIILRAVDWTGAPFNKLQALPKDAKPITLWPDRAQVLSEVSRSIRRVAENLRRSLPEP